MFDCVDIVGWSMAFIVRADGRVSIEFDGSHGFLSKVMGLDDLYT